VRVGDVTAESGPGTFEVDERAVLPPPVSESWSLEAGVATMAFDFRGALLVVQHNDRIVRVLDLVALEQVAEFEVDGGSCRFPMVRIPPDGSMAAAAVQIDGNQHIRVGQSDVLADAPLDPIAELEVLTRVRDLSWSPDGSMLTVASRLGTMIWDPVAVPGDVPFDTDDEEEEEDVA